MIKAPQRIEEHYISTGCHSCCFRVINQPYPQQRVAFLHFIPSAEEPSQTTPEQSKTTLLDPEKQKLDITAVLFFFSIFSITSSPLILGFIFTPTNKLSGRLCTRYRLGQLEAVIKDGRLETEPNTVFEISSVGLVSVVYMFHNALSFVIKVTFHQIPSICLMGGEPSGLTLPFSSRD